MRFFIAIFWVLLFGYSLNVVAVPIVDTDTKLTYKKDNFITVDAPKVVFAEKDYFTEKVAQPKISELKHKHKYHNYSYAKRTLTYKEYLAQNAKKNRKATKTL